MYKTEKRIAKAIRQATSHAVLLSSLLVFSPLSSAQENARMIDIPSQDLNQAIRKFSSETDRQILFSADLVEGKTSASVVGRFESEEGLRELLRGTGLGFEVTPDNVILIRKLSESSSRTDEQGQQLRSVHVEEVYVTARKREETIQEIPISITAFTADDLRAAGIRGLGDLEGIVPGVNMGGGGNGVKKDSNPFIRGVGQRETKVTLDPAVGTYIDGIYIARTGGAMLDTIGIERVEILRGPQGTLFGKNTTGGAISVTTIKPENEFSGNVSVNVGNYGRSDGAFSLNVPLIDNTLLARLTVASKNSDGYFTNVVDNTKWGDDNRITGIGQLRWLPTDSVMFDLFAERTRIRETPRPQKCQLIRPSQPEPKRILLQPGDEGYNPSFPPGSPNYETLNRVNNPNHWISLPVSGIDFLAPDHSDYEPGRFQRLCAESQNLPNDKFASDFAEVEGAVAGQGRYWVDTTTIGLTGAWDIGDLGPLSDAQFKSISSWREVETIADEDLDAVPFSYLLRYQPDFTRNTQISQEFQFTGSAMEDRLFFSTGLYYFQEETPNDDLYRAAGIAMGQPDNQNQRRVTAYEPSWERLETDNESYAWFGQIDFDLTSQLQLTAGLRYTKEKRWSRYSKAYADMRSLVDGEITTPFLHFYAPFGCIFQCSPRTTSPDGTLASIEDWTFTPLGYESMATTDEAWTPMVSLKYHFSDTFLESLRLDSAMTYVTYSEGFHAGGVTAGAIDSDLPPGAQIDDPIEIIDGYLVAVRGNPGQGVDDPITFEPETVKNYEIGLKLQAFDRRVQANMAVFYMDYTDMQITSTANRAGVPIPQVENVGKSVIQGFEGEFMFLPTINWRIMANVAYTDADMKEWNANVIQLNAFTGAVTGMTTERRDDEPMPRVPRWQAFLLTDYTFNLPNGGWITPSVSARYTSEIYHGFDRGSYLYGKDAVTAEANTFVDARINYLSADEKMEISLWVKNLTDKDDYLVGGIPLVDVTGATGQIFANPRTYGLEMTYRFGG